jgi:hypothetical protein
MKRKAKTRSIVIVGRQWFDKRNGNTYCSSQIIVNGVTVAKLGPTSGYGSYFEQMACDYLRNEGFVPLPDDTSFFEYSHRMQDRTGIPIAVTVADVCKENDL